jgi:hypothetical protein
MPDFNYLFISPHFPPEYFNFCTTLAKAGARVLGIGDAPYQELRKELSTALTEYYRVSSLTNYDEVYRAVGYYIHKYGRMTKIESQNEYWLELDARLREDFNVPGPRLKEVNDFKSKKVMKEKFIEAGLRVAKGGLVKNKEDAITFCKEVGFPVIAKPDIGVGATSTYKITDFDQLSQINFETTNFLFEEFISGDVVSFDGLVGKDGKVLFFSCHRYKNPVLQLVNENLAAGHYNYREISKELETYGKAVVKIFNLNEQFFHLEFFEKSDGTIICLEANLRPPGAYILDLINFSTDNDIYQSYANCLVKGINEFNYEIKYHALFMGRKNHFKYAHTLEDIRNKFKIERLFDRQMDSTSAYSLLCDHYFVFRTTSLETIHAILKYVDETI